MTVLKYDILIINSSILYTIFFQGKKWTFIHYNTRIKLSNKWPYI